MTANTINVTKDVLSISQFRHTRLSDSSIKLFGSETGWRCYESAFGRRPDSHSKSIGTFNPILYVATKCSNYVDLDLVMSKSMNPTDYLIWTIARILE